MYVLARYMPRLTAYDGGGGGGGGLLVHILHRDTLRHSVCLGTFCSVKYMQTKTKIKKKNFMSCPAFAIVSLTAFHFSFFIATLVCPLCMCLGRCVREVHAASPRQKFKGHIGAININNKSTCNTPTFTGSKSHTSSLSPMTLIEISDDPNHRT